MEANDIKFKDLELLVWYHVVGSEFGDLWFLIFEKQAQLHRTFSYHENVWVEPKGIIYKNDWNGGEFGDMAAYTKPTSPDWDKNCRAAIKTIFAKDVTIT